MQPHIPALRLHKSDSTANLSTEALVAELLSRDLFPRGDTRRSTRILSELADRLETVLDVRQNRFSLAHARGSFDQVFVRLPPDLQASALTGDVVEIGCGRENPLAGALLFYLLGARRGFGVEVDPVLDVPRAARALTRVASWLLWRPRDLVGDYAARVDPAAVLERARALDLAGLANGRWDAANEAVLRFLQVPCQAMPIETDSVSLMFSKAVMEHFDDVDGAIDEMARIAAPGGVAVHVIDTTDHGWYSRSVASPLAFLRAPGREKMVRGSNRLRPHEYVPRFEARGFRLVDEHVLNEHDVTADERATFAPRWRDVPLDLLRPLCTRVVYRFGG